MSLSDVVGRVVEWGGGSPIDVVKSMVLGIRLVVVQPPTNEDTALKWDAALRAGEIEVTGVKDLVRVATQVCTRSKQLGGIGKIRELLISGHGHSSGFHIGNEFITIKNIMSYAGEFGALSGFMMPDAQVLLLHCDIGHAEPLLLVLSGLLGGAEVHGG